MKDFLKMIFASIIGMVIARFRIAHNGYIGNRRHGGNY